MARRRSFQKQQQKKDIVWDPGEANAKQKLFYLSRTTYTAYGGRRAAARPMPCVSRRSGVLWRTQGFGF